MQLIPALAVERRRIVLLAPGSGFVPEVFRKVQVHKTLHQSLVAGAQRLRGHVYLSDGAIEQRDLSQDGRHVQDADDKSWFVLTVRGAAEVVGCARYRPHAPHVQFDELSVSRSALARSPLWGQRLRAAVQADITDAHHRRLSYVEVGGWALASDVRCTTEALRIALSMYTLARLLNGALGITTVTTRHHSCSILRRLGGRSLLDDGVELPSYFDPVYKCEMEILRFDSASPNPR
ncbi:MAG: hypothetical protein HYZ57_08410, partial [Acidobacteria bacterium]|nr:hypothetical protein [Acidobacteriota bacterium]